MSERWISKHIFVCVFYIHLCSKIYIKQNFFALFRTSSTWRPYRGPVATPGKEGRSGCREKVSREVHLPAGRGRWARRRMSAMRRPASSLRTLCRHPPARAPCRPSASCAGSWSWTPWTTPASTARSRPQSAPGRSRLSGPSWTRGPSTRLTTRAKPARAPG